MLGLLFHGPAIFHEGRAARLCESFPAHRAMLAGTLARAALLDSGLAHVEAPGLPCSAAIAELLTTCSHVLFVNHSKTTASGLAMGAQVMQRLGTPEKMTLVETNGMVWADRGSTPTKIVNQLSRLGFTRRSLPEVGLDVWRDGRRQYRRVTTAQPGEYVLLNGIFIGKAESETVTVGQENGRVVHTSGIAVKDHGLEKIDRFGPIDLAEAKMVTTPKLSLASDQHSRTAPQPVVMAPGAPQPPGEVSRDVVFIDHSGYRLFQQAGNCAAVVSVGDDTTSIVGDLMARYSVPVLGIVDGDQDGLFTPGDFAPGSCTLVVGHDDAEGLRVQREVFGGSSRTDKSFESVKAEVLALLGDRILAQTHY